MIRSLTRLEARNRLRMLLALPAVAAAAAVLAACSSSGTSSAGGGSTSTGSPAAATAGSLKTATIGGATVLTSAHHTHTEDRQLTGRHSTTRLRTIRGAGRAAHEHAERPVPSWTTGILRVVGSGLLIATAAIHLDLYLTGYRTIPTIGWLF